jgi:hypothetical protein
MQPFSLSRKQLKKWLFSAMYKLAIMVISQDAARALQDYHWAQQQFLLCISTLSHRNKYCLQVQTLMDA